MPAVIEIHGLVPLFEQFRFTHPVDWTLRQGEQWAVVGPNGAGKSLLASIPQGRVAYRQGEIRVAGGREVWDTVRAMEFRDIYSLVDCREGYYQQRWNASDRETAPLAGEIFEGLPHRTSWQPEHFALDALLNKRIVSLSSGELRKLLIMRTLSHEPKVLILDNPFIGLDAASRTELDGMLRQLAAGGIATVLLLSDPAQMPDWIDRVLPVEGRTLLPSCSPAQFKANTALRQRLFPAAGDAALPSGGDAECDFGTALKMEGVNVRYGDAVILENLDWEVRRGEKWSLQGPNGSGKSTLLSLVTGDNPQAYANRITLFDRRRGTGESIWDIKRRIGYLTPDIHTYYLQDIDPLEVVVSGFYDSVGLFRNATPEQYAAARAWLGALGGQHLAGRSFVRISFGEQRLVLLARAMVKDPALLILDEPLHGLDASRKRRATALIEAFASRPDRTLIYVTHYPQEVPACVDRVKTLVKHIR